MDKKGIVNYKLLVVVAAIAMMMIGIAVAGTGSSGVVENDVTIGDTCGITLNESSLSFGTVNAGQESSEKNILVTNTGSVAGNVSIEGTNWTNSGSFLVSYTRYADSSGAYAAKTNLTDSAVAHLVNIANGGTDNSFVQMQVPTGQAADTYTQNITYTSTC